jgi:Family of unknown function (DUF5329)
LEFNPKYAMTRTALSLLFLLSGFFSAAQAAEPASTKQEIVHLFSTLEASNCQFNRNGLWYGAKEAAGHLQMKYSYLQSKDLVPSAEKFIERAATESSLSGKAYQIKCADNVVQPSAPWFQAALVKYRTGVKK